MIEVKSQCTFWCWVLSDPMGQQEHASTKEVSMHLLVLGAF